MHKKVNLYRYLISFVLILLRFSLIFKGFQRLVSWLLHHFYTISAFGFIGLVNRTPIGCLAIRSFIFAAHSIVSMYRMSVSSLRRYAVLPFS